MRTPPFLLGAALLFWGIEARLYVLAAVLAGAVESWRFVKVRWRFGDTDFSRIADVCLVGMLGIFAYRMTTGWYVHASWVVVKWLPAILSPLLLAQLYNTEPGVNLQVLFLFKKKKAPADADSRRLVDLSFPFFAICLLAAGAANNRTPFFYIGICLLLGWAIWGVRTHTISPLVWAGLLLLAAGSGYGIQIGLSNLQSIITEAGMDWFVKFMQHSRDPYRTFTHMGDIGKIKLSNRIEFRVKPGGWDPGSLLLREASYDTYLSGAANWAASKRQFLPVPANKNTGNWTLMQGGQVGKTCTVAFSLKNGRGLLKLPNGTAEIIGLTVNTAQRNKLGAVKVEGKGLVTYTARYGTDVLSGGLPETADLTIPEHEAVIIQQTVADLKLKSLPPADVPFAIARFFKINFSYSLEQKPAKTPGTAIGNFLINSHAGHCEFFATAAALLLRGAGIPARYVTGYSVDRWDTLGGWCLVRAHHAHAWAAAYVDGRWVDLDATPGGWMESERQQAPPWQRLGDLWSWLTFGFSRWRWQQDTSGSRRYLVVILVPLMAIMVFRIFSKKRERHAAVLQKKPKAEKAENNRFTGFYPVEARLNEMGFYRQEWETVSAWIDRLSGMPGMDGNISVLRQLKDIHYRYRFSPNALTAEDETEMASLTRKWLDASKPHIPRTID